MTSAVLKRLRKPGALALIPLILLSGSVEASSMVKESGTAETANVRGTDLGSIFGCDIGSAKLVLVSERLMTRVNITPETIANYGRSHPLAGDALARLADVLSRIEVVRTPERDTAVRRLDVRTALSVTCRDGGQESVYLQGVYGADPAAMAATMLFRGQAFRIAQKDIDAVRALAGGADQANGSGD